MTSCSLFTTHVRPLLKYCSWLWNAGYICDLRKLELVQRPWTKHTDGMSEYSYKQHPTLRNLYSIRGHLICADLIKCWTIFHFKFSLSEGFIYYSTYAPTRGNSSKTPHHHSSFDSTTLSLFRDALIFGMIYPTALPP